MIVVATADFEVYHEAVAELRSRGVTFTTIEPGDPLPESTRAVIVAPDDPVEYGSEPDAEAGRDDDFPTDPEVVTADPKAPRSAIDEALALVRGTSGRTVIGVDPGERPGIAVCVGETVVAAFQVPLADAAAVIEREAADATDPLVRIGDGARLKGASIVDGLEDLPIELVDETGTTPYLGVGARGMGDVLAAVNIARLDGERIAEREVEPTAGEIQAIKTRSRERSEGDRTIDERLARRVARGELTIDEALEEHRNG